MSKASSRNLSTSKPVSYGTQVPDEFIVVEDLQAALNETNAPIIPRASCCNKLLPLMTLVVTTATLLEPSAKCHSSQHKQAGRLLQPGASTAFSDLFDQVTCNINFKLFSVCICSKLYSTFIFFQNCNSFDD